MSQAIRAKDIIEFSDGKNPVPTPQYGRIVGTAFLLSANKCAKLMLNLTAMQRRVREHEVYKFQTRSEIHSNP